MTGGGSCSAVGGKRRRSRTVKKGGAYGVGEAIVPGALTYGAAYTGPVNSAGNAIPDPTDPAGGYTGIGGRRRTRKSRKGSKKSRKSRKMRGGAGSVSMGTVGYGYTGTGAGGLADATQYTTQGNAY
jgi:hypothetical protein